MKKIIIVMLIIIVALCVTGCTTDKEKNIDVNNSMYVVVEGKGMDCYRILYDKETKVMYHMSAGAYNTGTLTLLVNADGSPKLYDEVTE